MTRPLAATFLFASLLATSSMAAPNDTRNGVPADTGTSVDELMQEKTDTHRIEPTPPLKAAKTDKDTVIKTNKGHALKYMDEAKPAAGEPEKQ